MNIPTDQSRKGTINTAQDTITNMKDTSHSILPALSDRGSFHGHRVMYGLWSFLFAVSFGSLVRMVMWVESPWHGG